MNIYQKMAAITAELQTVAKNLNVGVGNAAYKAVSERDIIDAVKPLEVKYGVYSYPLDREIVEAERLESEGSYNGNVTKRTTFYMRIKTLYRFVNVDKPDEYLDMVVYADGMDSGDKGCGKAMTYADKYALMKAYKISTGDDPDQYASVEAKYTPATKTKKPATKETKEKTVAPVETLICEECGNEIHGMGNYSAQDIADRSKRSLGKHLCYTCAMKKATENKTEKETEEGK